LNCTHNSDGIPTIITKHVFSVKERFVFRVLCLQCFDTLDLVITNQQMADSLKKSFNIYARENDGHIEKGQIPVASQEEFLNNVDHIILSNPKGKPISKTPCTNFIWNNEKRIQLSKSLLSLSSCCSDVAGQFLRCDDKGDQDGLYLLSCMNDRIQNVMKIFETT